MVPFAMYARNAKAADASTSVMDVPRSLAPVEFDSALIFGGAHTQLYDLKQFANGNPLLPGTFRSDVYLNSRWLGRLDVTVAGRNKVLAPCFDREFIAQMGLDLMNAPSRVRGLVKAVSAVVPSTSDGLSKQQCLHIDELAEGASAAYSSSQQKLDILIPQALLARVSRDAVSPDLWDDGITAAFVNYNFNAFRTSSGGIASTQQYLGLNTGLNLNGWYLRHDGTLLLDNTGKHQYQSTNTYVRRDLSSLKAAVTLGDGYTDGQLFDSIGFRGAMLATDERMLPASQRGYAPVIRGQARGNAKVAVSQNGLTLYETSVPPGSFVIDDLFPTGFGGDLLTTVTEADGSVHSFNTPFSSAPQLLRENGIRYQVVGGTVRGVGLQAHSLAVGTLQYGLNNMLTANAGITVTPEYKALLAGSAFSTPIGAASLDVTNSRFIEPGVGIHVGNSVRAGYSTLIPATLTNFTLATYRYSSKDFYSLRDAMTSLNSFDTQGMSGLGIRADVANRARDRSLISISQSLGTSSSMFLSGSSQRYWNLVGRQISYQVGYASNIGVGQLQVAVSRQSIKNIETRISVSFSIPLGGDANSARVNLNLFQDSATGTSVQANMSGASGKEQEYSYTVNVSNSPGATAGGLSSNWRSPVGTFGASATVGAGSTQASLSGNGSLLLHPGGVTFAPTLGQSMALIEAPNAIGAKVTGGQGARVDSSGFAVAPFLSPYQLNNVGLDVSALPVDVQLSGTTRQSVPRAGSVIGVHFKGQTGRWLIIRAIQPDGRSLPFGANVFDATDRSVGSVGQNSRIDVRVLNDAGTLRVQWGDGSSEQCQLHYQAPAKVAGVALTTLQGLVCQSMASVPH